MHNVHIYCCEFQVCVDGNFCHATRTNRHTYVHVDIPLRVFSETKKEKKETKCKKQNLKTETNYLHMTRCWRPRALTLPLQSKLILLDLSIVNVNPGRHVGRPEPPTSYDVPFSLLVTHTVTKSPLPSLSPSSSISSGTSSSPSSNLTVLQMSSPFEGPICRQRLS